MTVRNVSLGACRLPFDGPTELHRAPRYDRLVGIVVDLAPEAATILGSDDVDLLLGKPECARREQQSVEMRILTRHPPSQLLGSSIEIGQCVPWLHRVRD